MSLYETQRYMYDALRALETEGGARPGFDGYQLTDVQRDQLQARDVAALYSMGAHPVLLQQYARATGLTTDDLRRALTTVAIDDTRTARWQS